jgi:hypothetical protein
MKRPVPVFNIRFDLADTSTWSDRYSYKGESFIVETVAPRAKERGYFDVHDFLTVCRWKSKRPQGLYEQNRDADVRAVTQLALSTTDERLKICLLRALHGVDWPMASVLLHLADKGRYPILDFRALAALNVPQPNAYTFTFWWAYTEFCRRLSDESGVSMRVLDRALWTFGGKHPLPQRRPRASRKPNG